MEIAGLVDASNLQLDRSEPPSANFGFASIDLVPEDDSAITVNDYLLVVATSTTVAEPKRAAWAHRDTTAVLLPTAQPLRQVHRTYGAGRDTPGLLRSAIPLTIALPTT